MPTNEENLWKLKWEYLFNTSPELIIILSENHTILDANNTTLKFLGMKKEEVVGRKCYELFHNTDGPPAGCPFEDMKMRGWKPATNEMSTIIGDFIIEVFPMDLPGEGRKILHFARDITLIKEIHTKLINSLQRYTSFLDTLINLDSLMLRERNLGNVLNEAAKIICENENFNASWIILKSGDVLKTASRYGVDWDFEEKYDLMGFLRDEGFWIEEIDGESYIFLSMNVEGNFMGVVILLKHGEIQLNSEEIKVLRIMADNLAITIRERRLDIGRTLAYRELEKNIENFAMLIDGIRNPLAVIMGIAEGMIKEDEIRNRILEQIGKIEDITYNIDERWEKTEHLRDFLKNM